MLEDGYIFRGRSGTYVTPVYQESFYMNFDIKRIKVLKTQHVKTYTYK